MIRTLALLLPVLAVAACGGDEAPSYADAPSALEAADRARAGGELADALSAYQYAADHAEDPALRADAWEGLFRARVELGDAEGAVAAFEALAGAHEGAIPFEDLVRLADAAILGGLALPAGAVVDYAVQHHPDRKEELAKQAEAVERLETEGPGADLSGLGYTGG